jgi:hypothetical protein
MAGLPKIPPGIVDEIKAALDKELAEMTAARESKKQAAGKP